MNTLADAIIEAILYISMVAVSDDRADSDVGALESLVYILRKSSPDEKQAIREALERTRLAASEDQLRNPSFLDSLSTIEDGILGEDGDDAV